MKQFHSSQLIYIIISSFILLKAKGVKDTESNSLSQKFHGFVRDLGWTFVQEEFNNDDWYSDYDDDIPEGFAVNETGDPEDFLRDVDVCPGSDGTFSLENCPEMPNCTLIGEGDFGRGKLCINRVPFANNHSKFYVLAMKCIPHWENCDKCMCGTLKDKKSLNAYCETSPYKPHNPNDDRVDIDCDDLDVISFNNEKFRFDKFLRKNNKKEKKKNAKSFFLSFWNYGE